MTEERIAALSLLLIIVVIVLAVIQFAAIYQLFAVRRNLDRLANRAAKGSHLSPVWRVSGRSRQVLRGVRTHIWP